MKLYELKKSIKIGPKKKVNMSLTRDEEPGPRLCSSGSHTTCSRGVWSRTQPGRNQMLEPISLSGRTISLKPVLWKEIHHLKNSQNSRFRKSMFLITKYKVCGRYCFAGGFLCRFSKRPFWSALVELNGCFKYVFYSTHQEPSKCDMSYTQ